jgi:hypothetical protein
MDPVAENLETQLRASFEPYSQDIVEVINKASKQAWGLSQVVGAELVRQYLPAFQNGLIHKYLQEIEVKNPENIVYEITQNRRNSYIYPKLIVNSRFLFTSSRIVGIQKLPRKARFRQEYSQNNPEYHQSELFVNEELLEQKEEISPKFLYAILTYSFSGKITPSTIKIVAPDRGYNFPLAIFDILKSARENLSINDKIDLSVNEIEPITPTLRDVFLEFIEEERKTGEKDDGSGNS